MKILMLTWEFPPYIAGGLGMACYGLVKKLLALGIEIDLLLPTAEEVFFPLRKPEDADILPVEYLNPSRRMGFETQTMLNRRDRLELIGMLTHPESYITPGLNPRLIEDRTWSMLLTQNLHYIDRLQVFIQGHEPIFEKVQEFTARVIKYHSMFQYDFIHVHDWLTYPAGVFLKGLSGKKLVAHIHAVEFDRAGGPGDERIHNIEHVGLSNADVVIAVSNYTARVVMDRYRIEPSKIKIVHNAYSVSGDVRLKRRRLFKDPLVLFLGRVTLQKGPDYFLEVAGNVLKRYKNVRFVMAGSGDMFSKILNRSAYKRLKDRFLVSGFLNREQVEKILAATDIFVLPSVSEPFGIVPLEAMAFGAAAIISRQSGVAEIIDNAFKVDFWDVHRISDIIVDLLEHPEKRKAVAEAGQEEVMAIGWQKAAEKTRDVYRELACSI